jgi:hypothetical protein
VRAVVLRHPIQYVAAAPDLLAHELEIAANVGGHVLRSERCSSFATTAIVESGVESSCAALAASVARRRFSPLDDARA